MPSELDEVPSDFTDPACRVRTSLQETWQDCKTSEDETEYVASCQTEFAKAASDLLANLWGD